MKFSSNTSTQSSLPHQAVEEHLFVRHNGALVKLAIKDITHITADGNYCYIMLSEGRKYAVKNSLKAFKEHLVNQAFLQSSRGQLVNFTHVDEVNFAQASLLLYGGVSLPIGNAYRKEVESWINKV